MEVSETKKQEIAELGLLYKESLLEAKNILDSKEVKKLKLPDPSFEDYRNVATSLYIQMNINGSGSNGGSPRSRGGGNSNAPSTDRQQELIGQILTELEGEGDEIVRQFFEDNGLEKVDDLTKSQASALLDLLIEENKGRRDKGKGKGKQ